MTTNERHLETLPVDPAELTRANWWYNVAWYGLLAAGAATAVSAIFTGVFLFLQFWSGGVRESHDEWRTKTLELKTAEATREAERAKLEQERLAVEVARANERTAELNLELEKIKTPRTLNEAQQARIAEKLRAFAGTPYDFALQPDPEPIALMNQIDAALTSAGWALKEWPGHTGIEFGRGEKPGAGILHVTGLHVEIAISKREDWGPSVLALKNALEAEGLEVKATASTHEGTSPEAIHIVVGKKP